MIGETPTPSSIDAVHTTVASGLDIGNGACLMVVSAYLMLQF